MNAPMTEAQQLSVATTFINRYDYSDAATMETIKKYVLNKGISEEIFDMALSRCQKKETELVDATSEMSLTSAMEKVKQPSISSNDRRHAPVFSNSMFEMNDNALNANEIKEDLINNERNFEFTNGVGMSDILLGSAMKILIKDKRKRNQMKQKMTDKIKSVAHDVTKSMLENGFAVVDNFISDSLVEGSLSEMKSLNPYYTPSEIWVGKEDSGSIGAHINVPSVRGDKVLWMCGGHTRGSASKDRGDIKPCDPKILLETVGGVTKMNNKAMKKYSKLQNILEAIDAFVITELRDMLPEKLGKVFERSDAHVAVYPGNKTRFQKHIDNTSCDGRVLTALVYLNPGWKEEDGGALRITPVDRKSSPLDILPKGGRLAMFWSSSTMHEVLPTNAHRTAITVWYYDARERLQAIKNAKEKEMSVKEVEGKGASANIEARKEASNYIQDLVGDNVVPSESYLIELLEKANVLSEDAKTILAAVTNAPSNEEFVFAIGRLTVEKLIKLKASSSPDFL